MEPQGIVRGGDARPAVGLSTRLGGLALTAVVIGVSAGAALAQQGGAGGPILPPAVSESSDPPAIMMILTTVIIAALLVGANMLPSRRGHQD